uniref:Myomesin 1a (skelemin) n=1 Tax=Gadus morhua TaxID=8049 RepID=A0A8C5BBJ9_GADMO
MHPYWTFSPSPSHPLLCLFCCSHEVVRGLAEAQDEVVKEEGVNYVAMRNLFVRESQESMTLTVEKKTRKTIVRESAESLQLDRKLEERSEFRKKMNSDSLCHRPEFVVRPRGQTVWEGRTLKLHCTVAGWPKPRVAWYKNNVLIDAKAHPEKYTTESNYNMHSLEIKNCEFLDTALYHASALNIKGESSATATIVIKSRSTKAVKNVVIAQHGFSSEHGVTFETSILDKFEVAFGREGETLSLGCTVIIYPTIKMYQPEVVWYRNSVALKASRWVNSHWSGQRATLTLTHLNKEDEGLYTLRINTKSGFDSYSAYVFVRDADLEVEGVPVAPLDVRCHDANKDYVVVTWKQPAVEGSSPILGYFIDKCEVGTEHWAQCNDSPVKYARFPVTGLVEGRSYMFRVSALNTAGVSRPSRVSDAVVAMDPSDRARQRAGPSAPWTGMIKFTEEDPTVGVVPGEPSEVVVTEATKSYVVLGWKPPVQRGHEGVMYYIEKCVAGTDQWQRVNTGMPVKSPRYALFDLEESESYSFRVRCCNSAGVSEASGSTSNITVGDKLELPSSPGAVTVTRNCATSIVVSWAASREVKQLVGYYIEYSVVGSEAWVPSNNKPVKSTRFVCHGLTTGEKYVFKVKAVNAAGYSNSSPLSDPVLVKAAVSVPGKPSAVTLVEAAKDYMVLSWSAPASDGGAEITGYYVNYRTVKGEVVGKWHELNSKAVNLHIHSFMVTALEIIWGLTVIIIWMIINTGKQIYSCAEGLKENLFYHAGTSYVFRLRAENLAGVGKPSGVLGPILAQTHPGTHEIEVDVDDDGVISMIFQCSEMAQDSEFIWSKNYKSITDSSRITVVTQGGKSRAIFNSPSLEDLGTFSCMVTNTEGFSASYTLTEEGETRTHIDTLIPFKKEMSMDLLEKGRVRFWTQVEKCTAACKVEYVFNNAAVTAGQKYSMNFDQKTGIIEMFMDSLEVTDEGTFTFNLVDGKAKGTTSLVLIGDEFRELQKKSEFERAEWVRKQGPHFVEYLGFTVTEECNVLLKCQVRTAALCPSLKVQRISKSDSGVYEVKLRDERGKDTSTFDLTDADCLSKFILMNIFLFDLRESKITSSTRQECGVTGEQLWLKINEPTEKDKGKYTIDIFDGKDGLKRVFDLSGQGEQCYLTSFPDRARVVGGLPDVVAIQQGKSLNLTGNVWGDPAPTVCWLKNDKELVTDDRYTLKFENGKYASITIAGVTTADSGKYALRVSNKYGTENGDFTVSVYTPEDEDKKEAKNNNLESPEGVLLFTE